LREFGQQDEQPQRPILLTKQFALMSNGKGTADEEQHRKNVSPPSAKRTEFTL